MKDSGGEYVAVLKTSQSRQRVQHQSRWDCLPCTMEPTAFKEIYPRFVQFDGYNRRTKLQRLSLSVL